MAVATAIDRALGARVRGAQVSWAECTPSWWRPWSPYNCLDILVDTYYHRIQPDASNADGYRTWNVFYAWHDSFTAAVLSVEPNEHKGSWMATPQWSPWASADRLVAALLATHKDPAPPVVWESRPGTCPIL